MRGVILVILWCCCFSCYVLWVFEFWECIWYVWGLVLLVEWIETEISVALVWGGGGVLLMILFFLMIRQPPRSTQSGSSAASDVYKRQPPCTAAAPCQHAWLDCVPVPSTHLRAHETVLVLVCRLLLEKKKHIHTSVHFSSTPLSSHYPFLSLVFRLFLPPPQSIINVWCPTLTY